MPSKKKEVQPHERQHPIMRTDVNACTFRAVGLLLLVWVVGLPGLGSKCAGPRPAYPFTIFNLSTFFFNRFFLVFSFFIGAVCFLKGRPLRAGAAGRLIIIQHNVRVGKDRDAALRAV